MKKLRKQICEINKRKPIITLPFVVQNSSVRPIDCLDFFGTKNKITISNGSNKTFVFCFKISSQLRILQRVFIVSKIYKVIVVGVIGM